MVTVVGVLQYFQVVDANSPTVFRYQCVIQAHRKSHRTLLLPRHCEFVRGADGGILQACLEQKFVIGPALECLGGGQYPTSHLPPHDVPFRGRHVEVSNSEHRVCAEFLLNIQNVD